MTTPPHDGAVERLAQRVLAGDEVDSDLLPVVRALSPTAQQRLIERLLVSPRGRRWLRAVLLPVLQEAERVRLAARLTHAPEDFDPGKRDPTTGAVVRALDDETFLRMVPWLAGTNAAVTTWERVTTRHRSALGTALAEVVRRGTLHARETTLLLFFFDPDPPATLSADEARDVLVTALDDPEPTVRGLAAEAAARVHPDLLSSELARRVSDESERMRAAAWECAFETDRATALEAATALVADERAPLAARRSALQALSHALTTAEIAPLLAYLVGHPERALAEDAADALWQRHRHPVPAQAAVDSPHAAVREIGRRLLDPRSGSPAAGGDRPGAPASNLYRRS